MGSPEVVNFDATCAICGQPAGVGVACRSCGQVRGVPQGVRLSSAGKRFGEHVLEIVLVFVTLIIGWFVWSLIVYGRGQSPAKQLLGMRVVSLNQGTKTSWGMMFLREIVLKPLVTFFSAFVLYVPLFWLLWDKDNQELWDKAISTIVVDDDPRAFEHGQFDIPAGAAFAIPVVTQQGTTAAATKTCPDCAETIAAEAKVCRYCGYRFDAQTRAQTAPES